MPRALKPCGTNAAARRHRRLGEDLCWECAEAERRYQRDRHNTRPSRQARCGTPGGWRRHLEREERPCLECRAAHAKDIRDNAPRRGEVGRDG